MASMKGFHFTDLFLGGCIAGVVGIIAYGLLALLGIANVPLALLVGVTVAVVAMQGDAIDVHDYSLRHKDKENN